ncbi:uncharacterized protein LOC117745960 isoform X2 [Cyclopterus lumpus]|uniref:uncharacterized protein LOC117745960 isoform X2 n=1 Tax=Cyclopterus lumpus TaxID=8103 RepID=UPI001486E81F|nr:uncharacterized protein LOC117745960 isoform X2 [Cyclopterus lumpus]
MGATWISWGTTTTVIITILQIQARINIKTTAVEGQRFDFRCKYKDGQQNNTKYFCYDNDENDDKMSFVCPIRRQNHDQWHKDGRFSLYDNTTGAFVIVRLDNLTSEDSGTYRCGVDVDLPPDQFSFIELNVSREFHLSLFMTAAMCMAAMLFICLFTLCLWLVVQHRRPGPRQDRETSSDYETMMPGVRTEAELCCSSLAPDCADLSALPPPPDSCSHFTSKHRESTVTLGLNGNEEVDVPKHIGQYQHLDLSQLEEHVYHSLKGLSGPKDGPLVKEQINC